MLGLPEYIAMRINQDGINERDRSKRLENIRICADYVLEYFTSYIDISPEEEITADKNQKIEKYRKNISKYSREIIEWLVQNYIDYGKHVDRLAAHAINDPFFLLYSEDAEFRRLSYDVYAAIKKKCPFLSTQSEMLFRFLKDYHRKCSVFGESHIREGRERDFYINGEIDYWINDTWNDYNVDLKEFSYQYLRSYCKDYSNWPADHRIPTGEQFSPYNYNYKNLSNVFGIDELYRIIPKRNLFVAEKKSLSY